MQKITNLKTNRINHQIKALINKSAAIKKKLHLLIREETKSLIHYLRNIGRLKKRQIITVYQVEIPKYKKIWN